MHMKTVKNYSMSILCVMLFVLCSCTKENQPPSGLDTVPESSIVCESKYIAYITEDSKVYIAYDDGSGEYISGFDSIVQISGGENELAALNSDGELMFFDVLNKCRLEYLPDWEEIVSDFELGGNAVAHVYNLQKEMLELDAIDNIHMKYPEWYICNKKDGTTVINGVNWIKEDIDIIETWKDIVKYKAYNEGVIGLKNDGTIVAHTYTEEDFSEWKDIIDIECGHFFFGLKSDGTVLTNGYEKECYVQDWKDIIQISAVPQTTVGLCKDNTVELAYHLDYGQSEASLWKDIIFVEAAYDYVLGVKSDKTIIITSTEDNKFDFSNAPVPYLCKRK